MALKTQIFGPKPNFFSIKLCNSINLRVLISSVTIFFLNCSPKITQKDNFGLKLKSILFKMKLCVSKNSRVLISNIKIIFFTQKHSKIDNFGLEIKVFPLY